MLLWRHEKRLVSDMGDIAKRLINNADAIIDAIDQYLAKADEDLESQLSEEGYTDAADTVDAINDMADEVAEILQEQTTEVAEMLRDNEDAGWEEVVDKLEDMLQHDDTDTQIADVAGEMFTITIPQIASTYIQEIDEGLVIEELRKRTAAWVESWSAELGRLMRLSAQNQIGSLISCSIRDGKSIADLTQKIMNEGIRNEYYQARRVAMTEVLRAHSVAREEAIQQSPSTDRKEWRHTGAHKNQPRPNHVDMDGQIVPKDQPFELKGSDGAIYHPMYPRDPILPAGEAANCHCIHRGVAADDALGMSLEERRRLQQKYIEEDDGAWKKELDAQNRAKAGIQSYNEQEYGVFYGDTTANEGRIKKASWGRRFSEAVPSKKVRRQVVRYARKAVLDNSGTHYESMYLIDGETGAKIAAIDKPGEKIERGIHYTEEFKKKMEEAVQAGRKVIAIHNHPEGYPPSGDDFRKAFDNGYSQGFAIGANGQIYAYKNDSVKLTPEICDIMQEEISLLYASGVDVDRAYETVYKSHGLGYTTE